MLEKLKDFFVGRSAFDYPLAKEMCDSAGLDYYALSIDELRGIEKFLAGDRMSFFEEFLRVVFSFLFWGVSVSFLHMGFGLSFDSCMYLAFSFAFASLAISVRW